MGGGEAYINKLIDDKLKSTNDTISTLNQSLSDLNNYVKSMCKTRVLLLLDHWKDIYSLK